MATNSLADKMKFKEGAKAAILNSPVGYLEEIAPGNSQVDQALNGQYDWIQVFVKSKAEIDQLFPSLVAALKPDGLLWISFPKGSSKIQTDLTRDKGWDSVKGLKWINLISVNEVWSAFSLRPPKQGETVRVRG